MLNLYLFSLVTQKKNMLRYFRSISVSLTSSFQLLLHLVCTPSCFLITSINILSFKFYETDIKFYFTLIELIEEWRARKERCFTKSFLMLLEDNDHTMVYVRKLKENNCCSRQSVLFIQTMGNTIGLQISHRYSDKGNICKTRYQIQIQNFPPFISSSFNS